jgi:hypothetical protein
MRPFYLCFVVTLEERKENIGSHLKIEFQKSVRHLIGAMTLSFIPFNLTAFSIILKKCETQHNDT